MDDRAVWKGVPGSGSDDVITQGDCLPHPLHTHSSQEGNNEAEGKCQ